MDVTVGLIGMAAVVVPGGFTLESDAVQSMIVLVFQVAPIL